VDGPSHYIEAEKSFKKAQMAASVMDGASAVLFMQAAQFHATMALAGATGETATLGESTWSRANQDWYKAFAHNPNQPEE
jgi:hypothetical protein